MSIENYDVHFRRDIANTVLTSVVCLRSHPHKKLHLACLESSLLLMLVLGSPESSLTPERNVIYEIRKLAVLPETVRYSKQPTG